MNLPNKRSAFIAIVAAFATLAFIGYRHLNCSNPGPFRTVPVTRGDLRATISATGTVEPEEVVDVGAQVAGKIVAFGKDKNGKGIDWRA
jgi:HlyD family secretion protein